VAKIEQTRCPVCGLPVTYSLSTITINNPTNLNFPVTVTVHPLCSIELLKNSLNIKKEIDNVYNRDKRKW
jgi:hypothetical protein